MSSDTQTIQHLNAARQKYLDRKIAVLLGMMYKDADVVQAQIYFAIKQLGINHTLDMMLSELNNFGVVSDLYVSHEASVDSMALHYLKEELSKELMHYHALNSRLQRHSQQKSHYQGFER